MRALTGCDGDRDLDRVLDRSSELLLWLPDLCRCGLSLPCALFKFSCNLFYKCLISSIKLCLNSFWPMDVEGCCSFEAFFKALPRGG